MAKKATKKAKTVEKSVVIDSNMIEDFVDELKENTIETVTEEAKKEEIVEVNNSPTETISSEGVGVEIDIPIEGGTYEELIEETGKESKPIDDRVVQSIEKSQTEIKNESNFTQQPKKRSTTIELYGYHWMGQIYDE